MQAAYPEDQDSEPAREGEAAHWAAAAFVEGSTRPDELIGMPAPNGVVINSEMTDAALVYADDIRQTRIANGGMQVNSERQIPIPAVHEQSFGTVDCDGHAADTLYIWDFKYGFRFVDAYENWQMLNYAAGLVTQQTKRIIMRVIQPRAYSPVGPVKEWSISIEQFSPYLEQLRASASEAMSPVASCQSGGHCRYCTARHACPTALSAGMGLYEASGQAVPEELSPVALSTQLALIERAHEQLGFLKTGFQERVKATMKNGQVVPGYGLKPGKGSEVWTVNPKQLYAMGDLDGTELRNVTPKTPKQAREAQFDDQLLAAFSEKRAGPLKLSQINPNEIKRIFE
jgi:hypothetical protein